MNLVLHLVHTKQINPHDLLFSWLSTAFVDNVYDDAIGAGDVDAGDDDAIGDIDCGDYDYVSIRIQLVKLVLVMTQNQWFVLVVIKSLNQL